MDNKKNQAKGLAHYDRMIDWAEKQNLLHVADGSKMLKAIGESWGSEHCSFCMAYPNSCHTKNAIHICPLKKWWRSPHGKGGTLITRCAGGAWVTMNSADNWKIWLIEARKVRAFIAEYGAGE